MPMTKLYGAAELSEALHVPCAKLAVWMRRGHVPEPDWRLGCGPIWRAETVAAWMRETRKRLALGKPIVDRAHKEAT